MKIEEKSVQELKGYKQNNKTHPAKQVEMIANSIKQFWFKNPIIIDKNNEIIAWHGRLLWAKQLGMETVPCIIADDLTEEQVRAYRLLDNKIWDFGEYDMENIIAELWVIGDYQLGLESLDSIFKDLLPEDHKEIEEDNYEIPEEVKTDIVLWDLFEIWDHRLLCWDSTKKEYVDKLMNGEKADIVFTDPPFPNNSWIMHDMIVWIEEAFVNARAYCSWTMFWLWDNLQSPPFNEEITSKHIWHKTNWFQAWHYETIYVYHNDWKRHEQLVFSVENVWWENNRNEQGNHPTPKPAKLIVNIFEGLEWKLCLDLFLWSWSTMIASSRTKRKCYWIEIDPKYCQVIIDRMIKLDPTLEIKKNWLSYNPISNG